MSRSAILLLLVAIAYIGLNSGAKACPPNEEFKACGTRCEPSCDNPNPECIEVCVERCQCKTGYLRNANKQCVLAKNCPVH